MRKVQPGAALIESRACTWDLAGERKNSLDLSIQNQCKTTSSENSKWRARGQPAGKIELSLFIPKELSGS